MTSVSIISAAAGRIPHIQSKSSSKNSKVRQSCEELKKLINELNSLDLEIMLSTMPSTKFRKHEETILQLWYDTEDLFLSNSKVKTLEGKVEDIKKSALKFLEEVKRGKLEENCFSFPTRNMSLPANPKGLATTDELCKALLNPELQIVCLCGASCSGKRILAKNVYDRHPDIQQKFKGFAWVSIKKDFHTTDILQRILMQLIPDSRANIRAMNEKELKDKLSDTLRKKQCLVVLEDIVSFSDLQCFNFAIENRHSPSKILLITASENVARANRSGCEVYHMGPLTDEEECRKVLTGKEDFTEQEWNDIGKDAFNLSGGSPLIALILGKSLQQVKPKAKRERLLRKLDSETQVFGYCYYSLPHELKPCFLYMGQFPGMICVETLYLLLTAEDIWETPVAMNSFKEKLKTLASLKLVEVHQDRVSMEERYTYCQLLCSIRSLCISQGAEEDFFEVVNLKSSQKPLALQARRLAIYLPKQTDKPVGPFCCEDTVKKIRSLMIFDINESRKKRGQPGQEMCDLSKFINLRILAFNGVNFMAWKLPGGIEKKVLLKYLSFQGCSGLEQLPPNIETLTSLETLDLRVMDCEMTIPDVLYKLKRLRHLYFPERYKSERGKKLQLKGLEELEILVNFDTRVCTVKDLKLTKVRVLALILDGADLEAVIPYLGNKSDGPQTSLDVRECNTRKMTDTFKSMLGCKSLNSLRFEGSIDHEILKELAVSKTITEMDFNILKREDDLIMEVFGQAKNLRSLVLWKTTVVGNEMTFLQQRSHFPKLRILKLLSLEYLNKLKFEKGAVEKLSTLVVRGCQKLNQVLIPKALHERLQNAQEKRGEDEYDVEPKPTLVE